LRKDDLKRNYNEIYEKLKIWVKDKMFYLIIDESMDVKKRKVIIILIGVLDGSEVDSKVLSVTFHSKVDSSVVIQSVNDSLGNLFENKVPYDKMILVVTDQAPYMIKAIQGLKLFFQNLSQPAKKQA
jgi:hypothetical protein